MAPLSVKIALYSSSTHLKESIKNTIFHMRVMGLFSFFSLSHFWLENSPIPHKTNCTLYLLYFCFYLRAIGRKNYTVDKVLDKQSAILKLCYVFASNPIHKQYQFLWIFSWLYSILQRLFNINKRIKSKFERKIFILIFCYDKKP